MPDRIRRAVERAKGREVIIGIRPEHFEDAELAGDAPGAKVTVPIDLVESMGSDVYAYFTVRGEAHSSDLDDLAKDAGQDMHGTGTQINARLDAAANVRAGKEASLWVDTEKMAIFDAETGTNLTAEADDSDGAHVAR
jgi:multiple sugar transport system ATP-binding protein